MIINSNSVSTVATSLQKDAKQLTQNIQQRNRSERAQLEKRMQYAEQLRVANEIYRQHAQAQQKLKAAQMGVLLETQA